MDFEAVEISEALSDALELDEENISRFGTFKRQNGFWVFGNDQGSNSDYLHKVTILAGTQSVTLN